MTIYEINGIRIKSPKKIYRIEEVLCHKRGDFYEPISPSLLFKIEMARIGAQPEEGEKEKPNGVH